MNKENKPSEREDRIAKITRLQALGIKPYPAKAERTHRIVEALTDYEALAASVQSITIVGRLRRVRFLDEVSCRHGAAAGFDCARPAHRLMACARPAPSAAAARLARAAWHPGHVFKHADADLSLH